MEYLLDDLQSTATCTQILKNRVSVDDLVKDIEWLRAEYYKLTLGNRDGEINTDKLARVAYHVATIALSPISPHPRKLRAQALSVGGLIFEYLAELASEYDNIVNFSLNAILFYSCGEQEAQSATLAKRWRKKHGGKIDGEPSIRLAWCLLFIFLQRDFKKILRWSGKYFDSYMLRIMAENENGAFWSRLLEGCISVANSLTWGLDYNDHHFGMAIKVAREWGDTRLAWLGFTVRKIAEEMLSKSVHKQLGELQIPRWAAEALTMDSIFELWLPHQEAFSQSSEFQKGILSDNTRISLVNMPTSAGKSLIAEIAIIHELIHDSESKAIWVVPSRALVFEVQSRLSRRLRRIGITVSSLPGGIEDDPHDIESLNSGRVFVLTPEKLDGLLRRSSGILGALRVVIFDEMHKIADSGQTGRGWLLETLIAWLLIIADERDDLRLLFLSAVLPNRVEIRSWLGQDKPTFELNRISWRPTRLALFTVEHDYNQQWYIKLIQRNSRTVVASKVDLDQYQREIVPVDLLIFLLGNRRYSIDRSLFFFYTKQDLNSFIKRWVRLFYDDYPDDKPENVNSAKARERSRAKASFQRSRTLKRFSSNEADEYDPVLESLSCKFEEVYGKDHPYVKALKIGVGVDHGDVPIWLRQMIESAFRSKKVPILAANQAILEGVNLPIENLIIGCLGSGAGQSFRFRLDLKDYVNLLGRVGRALVDTEGRCFLIWNSAYWHRRNDRLSWDSYAQPDVSPEPVRSALIEDQSELIQILTQLTYALEGEEEPDFDTFGKWRTILERMYSISLAILEHGGQVEYSHLSKWMHRTLAWYQADESVRDKIDSYSQAVSRHFYKADRRLFSLASASSLSVRSSRTLINIANDVIENWKKNPSQELELSSIITEEMYQRIIDLQECWRQRPVTYGTRPYVPRIDHYSVMLAWIHGESWANVAEKIWSNHSNLVENTRFSIAAAYLSQMFEYRLPWIFGSLALCVKEADVDSSLKQFLTMLPLYIRYGVSNNQAVYINRTCTSDRSTVLSIANQYHALGHDRTTDLPTWLATISKHDLEEWLPKEPEFLRNELLRRIRILKPRSVVLKNEGVLEFYLKGWRIYGWTQILEDVKKRKSIKYFLRLEPENPFDPFAVAVDAVTKSNVTIGYIPSEHAEEVTELLQWGRRIEVKLIRVANRLPPKFKLTLLAPQEY